VAAFEVGVRRIDLAVFKLVAKVMRAETVSSIMAMS